MLGSGDELTLPMSHKLTMGHEKSSPPSFTGFQSQGVCDGLDTVNAFLMF